MTPNPVFERRAAAWTAQSPTPAAPVVDPHLALVARMAAGDQAAAAALFALCAGPLRRIAYAIVQEHADVDEIVSDTFTKAWRETASFDCARGSVIGWLTAIVRSRSRDCVRARTRRDRVRDRAGRLAAVDTTAINIGWSTAWDAVRAVETWERDALLSRVLRQLPAKQREVIELVFLHSVSHTQAAEHLGVPLGTVKTRVRLGLKRMRMVLEDAGVTRWTH